MLRKENEFVRVEGQKSRKDLELQRRQIEVANIKHEMIFRELVKRIETLENEN